MPTRRKRTIWPWIAAAAVITAGAIGVAYALASDGTDSADADPSPSPSPQTITVEGAVNLRLGQFTWESSTSACWGIRGYSDLRDGAQVVVTDPDGTTVGVSRLEIGSTQFERSKAVGCRLIFEVKVPAGLGFYGIEVSDRGKVQYAEPDLSEPVELTIG